MLSRSREAQVPNHPVDKNNDPEYWQALKERLGIPNFGFEELIDVDHYLKEIDLKKVGLILRGDGVALKGGGLREQMSKYLNMLVILTGGPPGIVGRQFVAEFEKEQGLIHIEGMDHEGYQDSLIEDEHEVAPGLIYKYNEGGNRVLFIVTGQCAAYCRYCTRGRLVGVEGAKTIDEIDQSFDYIAAHPEIEEIIFSGGDSFVLPKETFHHVIQRAKQLQESGQISSIRFGTRLPIHNPASIQDWHLKGLQELYAPNVMLHYNTAPEITLQAKKVLDAIRQAGGLLHSQSVFLNGVNNNKDVLKATFKKGQKHGVTPYYVYFCDEVEWGKHFMVPVGEGAELFYELRKEMTGLQATARLVIDVPQDYGKIPVGEGFWIDKLHFRSYKGTIFEVNSQGIVEPYNHETSLTKIRSDHFGDSLAFRALSAP